MSREPETDGGAWLTGSTAPTTLERTLAPGVALLVGASVLLVFGYLLVLFLV